MIDIHSHLLPGVDDGSRSLEQSLAVLRRFVQEGVKEVVLTPHLKASRAATAPVTEYRELFARVKEAAPAGIELHLGFEIMLDTPGADLTRDGLSLGRSNAVLVEFSRHGLPPNHVAELHRIRRSGRVPVVAHPERYPGCTADMVEEWRDSGAVIQVDAAAPLMRSDRRDLAVALLERGLVDLFAADNHGDSSSLAPTRKWLAEHAGEEAADDATRLNAARLLRDEETRPLPPMRIQMSLVSRLRELVLGR